MSVIETFYNKTFSVRRRSVGTAKSVSTYSNVSTGNLGCLRIVNDVAKLFNKLNYGVEYHLYCGKSVGVTVGDVIIIDSLSFNVEAVSIWEDLEDNTETHMRCVVTKSNTKNDGTI